MKYDIHYYDVVDSTMDIARDMGGQGAAEWTIIQAGEQKSGRGRRGNQWVSPKGNLYQSIILRPKHEKQYWGQLSFVVAVALKRAVIECGVCEDIIRLKWPNDVLITDQKLAGILIEAHDNHLILGTGVNIEHAPEDRAKIKDHHPISVNDFRDLFLKHLCDCYEDWDIKGFNGIRDEWLKHAYKIGEDIQARLPNITYEGVFEDLDSNGILLLREKSGYLRKIHSGEILNQRDVEQRR